MKKQLLCALALLGTLQFGFAQDAFLNDLESLKPTKIGDEFEVNISTAHPYQRLAAGVAFEREFYSENASYVKLYFEDFNLAPGDYVEIYSPNTPNDQLIYGSKGKLLSDGTVLSNFWSRVIFADKVIVKLHTAQASQGFGFNIKKVAYGYTPEKLAKADEAFYKTMVICGEDDKKRAACYKDEKEIFKKSNAVARLIIEGVGSCTGWLLGCDGSLMTNNHCIKNNTHAGDTDIVFDYQKASCDGSEDMETTIVDGMTFVKTNPNLDYTLNKIDKKYAEKYGYLSLSSKKAEARERLYIPQHPGGRQKEIAVKSDKDRSGYAEVNGLSPNGLKYYADTEPGSSGSPVLSYESNLVLAIHNAGYKDCPLPNSSAARSDKLISDIGNSMPECGIDDANLSTKNIPLPLGVRIYPNPASTALTITGLQKLQTINTLQFINVLGQPLQTINSVTPNETVNVSHLAKGVYFLRINNTYTVKFIKN